MNFMRAARSRYSKNKNPYVKKARLTLKAGGVGGASQRLSAGLPPPPEVKNRDIAFSNSYVLGDVNTWKLISTDTIYPIIQGVGNDRRVGRKIKVIGLVLRIQAALGTTNNPVPATVDIVWDKSPNGALPTIGQIYGGSSHLALPNPDYGQRFQFLKRLELNPSGNCITTTRNCTLKLSHTVVFDASGGFVTDLESGNLVLVASGKGVGTFEGTMRVLYVDA